MNQAERAAAHDAELRARAVHGWAFEVLPGDEVVAIRAFLNGADPSVLPEHRRRAYQLVLEQDTAPKRRQPASRRGQKTGQPASEAETLRRAAAIMARHRGGLATVITVLRETADALDRAQQGEHQP